MESNHLHDKSDQFLTEEEEDEDYGDEIKETQEKEPDRLTVGGGSSEAVPAQLQMCSWVPPNCCLIPLPESPAAAAGYSDDESDGEHDKNQLLSEHDLQRQCEKELEDLFGFKPPAFPVVCEELKTAASDDEHHGIISLGEDKSSAAVVNKCGDARPGSVDSGVASVDPNFTESEKRDDQETEPGTLGSSSDKSEDRLELNCGSDGERVCLNAAVDEVLGQRPKSASPKRSVPATHVASRLRMPSEKLHKCSLFTGSVSSEKLQ